MSYARQDGWITLLALLALLAWDASGADLWAARWFGGAQGFAARDSWWAATLLHDGGRVLAWGLLALQVAWAIWPGAARPDRPTRAVRVRWLGVMLLCLLLVPAIKRLSRTSCPWDLAVFGGAAQYLSHWRWGQPDGGAGHCFPSGHAVAAFAFLGLYFLWRDFNPARARGAAGRVGGGRAVWLGPAGARRALPQPHDVVGLGVLDGVRGCSRVAAPVATEG
jgi:membrane-associated PAP2 superfamily phosphatase